MNTTQKLIDNTDVWAYEATEWNLKEYWAIIDGKKVGIYLNDGSSGEEENENIGPDGYDETEFKRVVGPDGNDELYQANMLVQIFDVEN